MWKSFKTVHIVPRIIKCFKHEQVFAVFLSNRLIQEELSVMFLSNRFIEEEVSVVSLSNRFKQE